MDFASRELEGQLSMGVVILGHHDKPTGFLVEAVNDARTHLSAHPGERGEVVEQGIDEGSAVALVVSGSCAGVNHHAGGVVVDRAGVGLVEGVVWGFLRGRPPRGTVRLCQKPKWVFPPTLAGRSGGGVLPPGFLLLK